VANIKSQIKRIGTNRKATERNKAVKSEVKTAIRATRKLDKAASKGVIHKNQAANRKSSIAKQVAAL
jgi:small subunit ribosomal protein S20